MAKAIKNKGAPAARVQRRVRVQRLVFDERGILQQVLLSSGDILDVTNDDDDPLLRGARVAVAHMRPERRAKLLREGCVVDLMTPEEMERDDRLRELVRAGFDPERETWAGARSGAVAVWTESEAREILDLIEP